VKTKTIKYKEYSHNPPLIWLDTNIVIGIRDALSLSSKQTLKNKKEFIRLFNILKTKVDENKILCPFLGQRTEYSDGDHLENSDQILMDLSKGFQISGWQIRQVQVKRMLECFLKNKSQFNFTDSDLLYNKEKYEPKENKIPFRIVILNEKSKRSDRNFLFNDLKRRKKEVSDLGLTYSQVLKSEQEAAIPVLQISINKIIKHYGYLNMDFTENDEEYYHIYTLVELSKLAKIKDEKKLFALLKNFFLSEYFYAIPIDKISSTIVAHIMTEGKNVKYSDIGDINNLSLMLPYASYIITENRMAHILLTRKIDKEFGVEIYRTKDIDKFIKKINNL